MAEQTKKSAIRNPEPELPKAVRDGIDELIKQIDLEDFEFQIDGNFLQG